MHAHRHARTHAHITHAHIHARTHTHTHTHTHTNTHTHTCISAHKAHTSCQFTAQKASPTFQHRLRCFPLLVLFFLSLWIYLWLAETSQQPISQTTWLKVIPHCNHCNPFNQLIVHAKVVLCFLICPLIHPLKLRHKSHHAW